MKKEYFLFDLDGTIAESAEGIVNSLEIALKKFGIDYGERKDLYKFVGPPFHRALMENFNLTDEQATQVIKFYRETYEKKGIYEQTLYDGIISLFDILKSKGAKIALATAKPAPYAKEVLKYFKITKYFSYVAGSSFGDMHSGKELIIADALKNLNVSDPSRAVMIGDRVYDIEAATKTGIHSIGVLYGYGDSKEFENAAFVAKTPKDLTDIILKNYL